MSGPTRREALVGLTGLLAGCSPGRAAEPGAGVVSLPRPLAAGFQAGMNLAHLHRPERGYGSARSRLQLERLRGLGLTHIVLTPFGYLPDLGGTRMLYGDTLDPTLTDAHLLSEMAAARSLGLTVVVKPHLWGRGFGAGKGRQDVQPDDWAAWFGAYTGFLRHHARVAARGGADWLCVGLEYLRATEQNPGAWGRVADACREDFPGRLTYAANWHAEVDAFADWASFDAIGVNAYYPLSKAADPGIGALVAGWQPHLDRLERLAARHVKPVLFCEAGLRAVRGAAARPWEHGTAGDSDPALQARGYEALLRAAADRPWLQGVWWWKWFTDDPGERDPYCPRGRPAEKVIAAWHS